MKSFEGSRAGEECGHFCWCPPGTFKMGFAKVEVELTQGFWMGKYPVTQAEYKFVVNDNPSGFRGPTLPAESVGREGVFEFCRKLTCQEQAAGRLPSDWEYNLPTECQWEYACRAGATTRFSWGDEEGDADKYAWHMSNAGFSTHPVGTKKPNRWGIYDTAGNTLEWCRDAFDPSHPNPSRGKLVDPEVTDADLPLRPGESKKPFGVCHGGGWFIPAAGSMPEVRIPCGSGDQGYLLGFRIAIVKCD